jgi:hypothetical protein
MEGGCPQLRFPCAVRQYTFCFVVHSINGDCLLRYRTVARKVSFAEQLDYDTRSFSRLQLYHDTQTMYSGTCSWLADWNYMCRRGIIFPNSKSECYPIAGFGERTHTSRDQRACHLAHRVYGIYPQDLA